MWVRVSLALTILCQTLSRALLRPPSPSGMTNLSEGQPVGTVAVAVAVTFVSAFVILLGICSRPAKISLQIEFEGFGSCVYTSNIYT